MCVCLCFSLHVECFSVDQVSKMNFFFFEMTELLAHLDYWVLSS